MKNKELRLLLSQRSGRKLFSGAVFGALISTAIVVAQGYLVAAVIVGLIYHHPNVMTHILMLATLWIIKSLFSSQFDRWASTKASVLKRELRDLTLRSTSQILETPSSHLATLLIKGANSLDVYLARFLPQMFNAVITPLTVIVAIAFQDLTSSLIALLTLPLIPLFGALIGRFTNDAVRAKWISLGLLSRYFEDSLRGIFTLAIFGRHKNQSARIQEMGDRYTEETMRVLRISFLSALVLELLATISVAVIAVSIGLRLVGGSIDFFPALVVLVLAPEVYFPLRNAASLFHASADGATALSELLASKKLSKKNFSGGEKVIGPISSLRWSQWSSPYGEGKLSEQQLVPGDLVVIRGESGLGKTTFLNSLLGFNESANIEINGEKLSDVERDSLHRQIGWIPQIPTLLSGSLRQQFRNLLSNVSDREIEGWLSQVGLNLSDLPEGLETTIGGTGEKSGKISGGQKRKIALARALAISPRLIIADEPTADLDSTSANRVLRILEHAAQQGSIVIATLHASDQHLVGAREVLLEK